MCDVLLGQSVRLLHDVPTVSLHGGDVGTVCSCWFDPETAYEVEFARDDPPERIRVLLTPADLEPVGALSGGYGIG